MRLCLLLYRTYLEMSFQPSALNKSGKGDAIDEGAKRMSYCYYQ